MSPRREVTPASSWKPRKHFVYGQRGSLGNPSSSGGLLEALDKHCQGILSGTALLGNVGH